MRVSRSTASVTMPRMPLWAGWYIYETATARTVVRILSTFLYLLDLEIILGIRDIDLLLFQLDDVRVTRSFIQLLEKRLKVLLRPLRLSCYLCHGDASVSCFLLRSAPLCLCPHRAHSQNKQSERGMRPYLPVGCIGDPSFDVE